MDRRTFLCELALGTLAAPVSSEAQQPRKTPRIGILVDGYPQPPDERHRSPLIQGLRDFGWVPQETVLLEVLHSRGQHERLPELAAALVRRQVDVIWVNGPPAAVATARATKTIPIVFWGVSFPVELGLVASLARPGGNVTGFAWTTGPELLTKQLEFLKTIAPGTIRVASVFSAIGLYDVNGRPMAPLPAMELAARQLAMELRRFPVQDPEELNRVLASILDWRAHALYVHGDPLTGSQHRQIIDFANNNRLPGLFGLKHFALAGGLLTYAPDTDETVRRSAYYLDKILKGAKPADLPVEQPTKFELVINLKTAKALGITIPPSLLLRADQVIE